jgi:hypothetical protein
MSRPHCKSSGKVRMRTEQEAEKLLEVRKTYHRGEQRTYLCDDCDGWHLTSWGERNRRPVVDLRSRAPIPTPRDVVELFSGSRP